jgi:SAM-dependent methyltransferase
MSKPSRESVHSQIDYSIQYGWAHPDDPRSRARELDGFRNRLAALLTGVPRGSAVDIGCGTGVCVEALQSLGFEAIGVERDARQAAIARSHAVPVVETSDIASELSRRTGELLVVVMFDVLEHLAHDEQLLVLKAAKGSLTHGGRVLIQVPNASSPVAMHRLYGDWTHRCSFTDRSLEFLLNNAGFRSVEFERPRLGRRPPLRLWRPAVRRAFVRWLAERMWQALIRAEVGNELGGDLPPIGVDMVCAAW